MKKEGHQSFQVPQHLRLGGNRLTLPKMAPLRVAAPRPLEGKPKQVAISRNAAGAYHASILCETENPEADHSGGGTGIDPGP